MVQYWSVQHQAYKFNVKSTAHRLGNTRDRKQRYRTTPPFLLVLLVDGSELNSGCTKQQLFTNDLPRDQRTPCHRTPFILNQKDWRKLIPHAEVHFVQWFSASQAQEFPLSCICKSKMPFGRRRS